MRKKTFILFFVFLLTVSAAPCQTSLTGQLEAIERQAVINPEKAKLTLDSLAGQLQKPDHVDKAKIRQLYGTIAYHSGKLEKAISHYNEAADFSNRAGDSTLLTKSWNNMGVIFVNMARFDTALYFYNKALKVRQNQGDTLQMGRTLMNMGNIYNRQGLYITATQYYYKALEIFEKSGFKREEATTLANIGVCQHSRGHKAKADSNFQRSYEIFRSLEDTTGMLTALNNSGTIQMNNKQYGNAEKTFHHILEIARLADDEVSQAFAYNNLAEIAILDSNRKEAETYLERSLAIFEQYQYRSHLAEARSFYAEVLFHKGEREKALNMMEDAYQKLLEINEQPVALSVGERYVDYLRKAEDYQSEAELLRELGSLRDSLFSSEKTVIVEDMEAKYHFERQKKELQLSRKKQEALLAEKKFQQEQFKFYAVGSLAILLLLAGSSLFFFYRNRQKNKLIREKEKSGKLELEYSELQNKTLQRELANKNKELSRFALHISEKNRFLQDISQSIKKADSGKERKAIYLRIVKSMQSDKESEAFYKEVNQFMSDFRTTLESKYKELTEKDIRLCTLIQLGLSSKDIAAIFNISPKSVDMQRYRLRKKMDIPKNTPIEQWLEEVIKQG